MINQGIKVSEQRPQTAKETAVSEDSIGMTEIDNVPECCREKASCCGEKHKTRDTEEYRDLIRRLNRIEGQVRGIKGMVERDCYCVDILTQVSAIQAALNAFNRTLLSNHIHSCVVDDIRAGNDEVVDELVDTIRKLMK